MRLETRTHSGSGSPSITIRRFRPSDQEAIRRLYRETVAENPDLYYRPLSGPQLPDDITANFGHPRDAFYVATETETIVAFCGLRTQPEARDVAHCMNGVVLPPYRGLGIYRKMFALRESDAIASGIKTLLAMTSEKNTKMVEFLIKAGFEVYHVEEPIPGFLNLRKIIEGKDNNEPDRDEKT